MWSCVERWSYKTNLWSRCRVYGVGLCGNTIGPHYAATEALSLCMHAQVWTVFVGGLTLAIFHLLFRTHSLLPPFPTLSQPCSFPDPTPNPCPSLSCPSIAGIKRTSRSSHLASRESPRFPPLLHCFLGHPTSPSHLAHRCCRWF